MTGQGGAGSVREGELGRRKPASADGWTSEVVYGRFKDECMGKVVSRELVRVLRFYQGIR